MASQAVPKRAGQRQMAGHDGDEPPLQSARCADANQLTHEQPEIETTGVDQQPLQNARVPTQVHAALPTGLIEMCKGPLQTLRAESQQAQATRVTNASTIAAHRVASRRVLLPVP